MVENSAFQARASIEGRAAQDLAARVITGCGFTIVQRNQVRADLGVTVNFVTRSRSGEEWFFDVSGAFQSERAGLIRTDTVWKALGRCSVLTANDVAPIVLLTTNLPQPGSRGDRALRSMKTRSFYDVIEATSPRDRARMKSYSEDWWPRPPLPGFWTIESIYGQQALLDNTFNANTVIPVEKAGDPLADLLGQAEATLQHRVKVMVPSKDRNKKAIPLSVVSSVSREIGRLLVDFGGGLTSQSATGSWVDPVGGMAHERVTVLEVYSNRVPDNNLIDALKRLIIATLNQDAMAVVIDGWMYHFSR